MAHLKTAPPYRTAILAAGVLLATACGPSGETSADAGTDAGEDGGSSFERTRQYPGYCRGLVHKDRDGEPDAVEYGRFDGEVLSHREYDADHDGDIDRRTDFSFDDDGRLVEREVDEGPDGNLDGRYRYEYDDRGRRTHERVDADGDGTVETVITFDHDSEGRRIRGEGRSTRTDEVELVIQHRWTEGGLLDLVALDGVRGAPDREPDQFNDYVYDRYGNVDQGRFDYDANGRADLIVEYEYGCWATDGS